MVQCTVTCFFWKRARLIEISLSRVGGHMWYFVDGVVELREGGFLWSLFVWKIKYSVRKGVLF